MSTALAQRPATVSTRGMTVADETIYLNELPYALRWRLRREAVLEMRERARLHTRQPQAGIHLPQKA